MSRTRERSYGPIVGGKRVGATSATQGVMGYQSHQLTTDEVDSPGVPHGFYTQREVFDIQPLNAKRQNGYYYENWIPITHVVAPSHPVFPGQPSLANATNTLMARTNPGRAEVSIPRFAAELRDIPDMIKFGGDMLRRYLRSARRPRDRQRYLDALQGARDGAGIYIGNEFGVQPIISDLRKIIQFQERTSRRMDELRRLYGKGGLKRRFTIYSNVVNADSQVSIASELGASIEARRNTVSRCKIWGTIRWKPTDLTPGYARNVTDDNQLRYLARRAIFGLGGPQLGDLWDIIPWTWLSDWFADVGTALHANNNRIPARPGVMCIMTTRSTTRTFTPLPHAQFPVMSGGGATVTVATKERSVRTSGSLPTAGLPFLNGWQTSILSALAVTRARR